MADKADLAVGIDANVTGTQDAKRLADTVATVGDALRELVSTAKSAAAQLERVERTSSGVQKNSTAAAKGVRQLANAYTDLTSAQAKVKTTAGDFRAPAANATALVNPNRRVSESIGNLSTKASRESAEATAFAQERALKLQRESTAAAERELRVRRDIVEAMRAARLAPQQGPRLETSTAPGSAAAVAARFQQAGLFARQDTAALGAANQQLQQAVANLGSYEDRLANTRYALYGFTTSLAIAGVALGAANIAIVKSAADFETYVATIQRTAGVSGEAVGELEDSFIRLGQNIPTSFKDIGAIGALAGQLDIPTESLENFTKVVAQFTATTNVGVEAAATAFGRLDTLLPDVQGNYEALGSSILNVGVNSVATESEIIQTTSQIAAAGAQARFTADEVIGLAASFASLGVAPEAARGTTIRVLSEIRQATLEGGASLEKFGKIAGTSGEEFKAAWKENSGGAFIQFLKGLQSEGENAETSLRDMGITAVRDINALLKLSQNVELVGDNFGYAAAGFSDATQLGDSFAVIAETVNARLQELVNSFQAFVATLGKGGLGPVGAIIDGLKNLLVIFTDLADNPFAQTAATIIGAMTALSAIILIAGSGFGRFIATMLAFQPVKALFVQGLAVMNAQILVVQRSAAVAGVELTRLQAASIAAGRAMKGALASTGIGLAAVVGISVAMVAFENLEDQMKSAGTRAKEAFGDLNDLSAALQKDTFEAEANAKVYGTVEGKLAKASTTTQSWVSDVEDATGGQVTLGEATEHTATTIESQTYKIGENTAALLANKLANIDAIQEFVKNAAQLNNLSMSGGGPQLDVEGYLAASARNDTDAAKKILEDYRTAVQNSDLDTITKNSLNGLIAEATNASSLATGALSEAAAQITITDAVNKALGVNAQGTAGNLDEEGASASTAATKLQELAAAIDAAFADQNQIASFSNDFSNLVTNIIEAGTSFNEFSSVGRENLANLQTSIASTITAGESMGISATDSVAALFLELQKQGVSTATLLSLVAGLGKAGVNTGAVKSYLNGSKQLTNQSSDLSKGLGEVSKRARDASKSVGGAGGSAAKAAEQVRTLKDYASDLGGVFNRAFEIRFSGSQALDTITKGWQEVADAAAEARDKFREAQAELLKLSSDKSINEYFLSIANQYGDTLRAADITAKLAEINNNIAEQQKKAADATAEGSTELDGNSKAAIANRATLLGLVGNYQSYIESLASSGASQETLAAESLRLRNEFVSQATQMGYNSAQVQKYAAAFDDMTLAINRVPRNITVTANTNPALQAINELEARLRQAASQTYSPTVTAQVDDSALQRSGERQALLNRIAELQAMPPTKQRADLIDYNLAKLKALGSYATGGYTGNGGTNKVAGAVHGKEFVFDAASTKAIGPSTLLAMMQNRSVPTVQAPSGNGSGIQVVELSAYDRQLLRESKLVDVAISGTPIQQATNMNNVNSNKRGAA